MTDDSAEVAVELDRIRGGGPTMTVDEVKQWYAEGYIPDDELDEAIELALIEEMFGPHHSTVVSKEFAESVVHD
jgi:hypothetical protein